MIFYFTVGIDLDSMATFLPLIPEDITWSINKMMGFGQIMFVLGVCIQIIAVGIFYIFAAIKTSAIIREYALLAEFDSLDNGSDSSSNIS